MQRILALVLLVVGVGVAGAFGARNGAQHTSFRAANGVVTTLEAAQGGLKACAEQAAAAQDAPADAEAFDRAACEVGATKGVRASGALLPSQSVDDALATATKARDDIGLPDPGARLLGWLGRSGLPWGVGVVLIVVGAVLARRDLAQRSAAGGPAGTVQLGFRESLVEIEQRLAAVAALIADTPLDGDTAEAREALDATVADLVLPVIDGRGRFIARHGLGRFAEYFGAFSAGERNMGRAWSALTDGQSEVARDAVARSRAAFAEALETWDRVELERAAS